MAKTKTSPEIDPQVRSDLTSAFVEAIELTRPPAKKSISNRKKNTPWTPKDGSPKLKLKRKMYHHSLLINPARVSNEEIALLNELKPGVYLGGRVKVTRRKDRGIDITYPVKTNSQRLKLAAEHGVYSFTTLLSKCIEESKNPVKIESEEVED